jgi:hypothetical protein
MERTKKEWIDWASEQGFTKEDAKRALANFSGTIDEIEASRAIFQYAAIKIKTIRGEGAAAKGQLTKVKKENRLLNDKLDEVEKQYEGVLSSILGKLSFIYSWAIPKGLERDEEIEEVLETEYKNNPKKAA